MVRFSVRIFLLVSGNLEIGGCDMEDVMAYLMTAVWLMDMIFITLVLFIERKRPETALCWLLTFIFLPIVGCVLYLFFGISLPYWRSRSLPAWRGMKIHDIEASDECCEEELQIRMNEHIGEGRVRKDNRVAVFVSGVDKYSSLVEDIEAATDTIHLLYFIIRGDRLGRHLIELLTKKAKQGVRVRLLYDHGGSFFTSGNMFHALKEAGGEVVRFFPIRLGYYLRVNYRNHRKIVVIDGKIGYLGGMNVGEEYLGTTIKRQIPWRDAHLRIEGSAVYDLQKRFIEDWRFARAQIEGGERGLFPPMSVKGDTEVQIVSSGPYHTYPAIKWNYLRMIYGARRSIWLQTPYFVPDESFLEAVRIAIKSAVEVRLLLSRHSDNRLVQKVSVSYAKELWQAGARVAFYEGFLHSKMGIIDAQIVTLGTSNLDRRSFALNFETNAILYDEGIGKVCRVHYLEDWKKSQQMKEESDWDNSLRQRAEESIGRLFAPLL